MVGCTLNIRVQAIATKRLSCATNARPRPNCGHARRTAAGHKRTAGL